MPPPTAASSHGDAAANTSRSELFACGMQPDIHDTLRPPSGQRFGTGRRLPLLLLSCGIELRRIGDAIIVEMAWPVGYGNS